MTTPTLQERLRDWQSVRMKPVTLAHYFALACEAADALDVLQRELAAAQEARQRAEALAESYRQDAELGRILMRYIDRLTDPTPEDSLELIVGQMSKDVHAAIDAAREGK